MIVDDVVIICVCAQQQQNAELLSVYFLWWLCVALQLWSLVKFPK